MEAGVGVCCPNPTLAGGVGAPKPEDPNPLTIGAGTGGCPKPFALGAGAAMEFSKPKVVAGAGAAGVVPNPGKPELPATKGGALVLAKLPA